MTTSPRQANRRFRRASERGCMVRARYLYRKHLWRHGFWLATADDIEGDV
ncbi:unnamed protein product, partial [marine sediment metagenome]